MGAGWLRVLVGRVAIAAIGGALALTFGAPVNAVHALAFVAHSR
jgi:hypothetical protein